MVKKARGIWHMRFWETKGNCTLAICRPRKATQTKASSPNSFQHTLSRIPTCKCIREWHAKEKCKLINIEKTYEAARMHLGNYFWFLLQRSTWKGLVFHFCIAITWKPIRKYIYPQKLIRPRTATIKQVNESWWSLNFTIGLKLLGSFLQVLGKNKIKKVRRKATYLTIQGHKSIFQTISR